MPAPGGPWVAAWMRLQVDPSQVKKDVEKGLGEAKGDEAGKRVGDEFGKGFGDGAARPVAAFHEKFATDSAKSGHDAGDQSGRSFGQAFAALTAGIARTFWAGFTAPEQTRDAQGQFTAAGGRHGKAYADSFHAAFSKMLHSLSRDTDQELSLTARHIGGFSPGILGIRPGTKRGLIGGGVAAGLGAAPALFAGAGALGVAGAGGGLLAAGFGAVQSQVSDLVAARTKAQQAAGKATTPAQQQAAQAQLAQANAQIAQLSPALQSIIKSETQIQDTWKKFATSLAPLFAGPVAQVAKLFSQLTGPLHQVFAGAATLAKPLIDGLGNLAKQVLPLLGQAFRAVAPLVKPLLDGLTGLITGLLPGLITLLHAAAPAVQVLGGFLAQLGKAAGNMLGAFAPAIKASAVVLQALGDVISALFPLIGQLAGIFAAGLAPIFTQLAGAIRALMPFLVLAGKAIADLAGVMFGVLAAGLKAVVSLLQAVAPALTAFAGMLTQIFTVLENKNFFQFLATAIEAVIPEIASLINALLGGLMPILPPIISFMTQLATMVAGALGNALKFAIPLLVTLATTVLGAIARVLPVILPALSGVVNAIGSGLGRALAVILPPLAQMAGILAGALAKVLPVLVPLFVKLAGSITGALVGALIKLMPPLLQLATVILADLAALLPAVTPVLTVFVNLFTPALSAVITAIATALAWFLGQFTPRQLEVIIGIVGAFLAFHKAVELLKAGWGLLMGAMKVGPAVMGLVTNPVFLIIGAIALLAFGIFELVKHWGAVWRTIKDVAKDAWEFLTHGWGQFLIPALWLVRKAVELVRDHWRDAWNWMKQIAHDFYQWLWNDFGAKIYTFFVKTIPHWWDLFTGLTSKFINFEIAGFKVLWHYLWDDFGAKILGFFTKTIPGWFDTAQQKIGQFWNGVKSVVSTPIKWVVNTVLGGLAGAFDTITSALHLGAPIPKGPYIRNFARGGRITAGGGPTADDVLVRVSRNETIVSADHSAVLAPAFAAIGVPGYQRGGIPVPGRAFSAAGPAAAISGPGPFSPGDVLGFVGGAALNSLKQLIPGIGAAGTITKTAADVALNKFSNMGSHGTGAVLAQIITAVPKLIVGMAKKWLHDHAAAAGGAAIVADAMQWLGRIPYVWGGTAVPGGADCSGFTQTLYARHGINAPRTSEAQGAWVRRTGPVPGGLAFYHSLAGGPDPGHVALVKDAATVISQGGGMGPTLMGLHGMPLLWTGVPPTGFPGGAGGAGAPGTSAQVQSWIAQALAIAGAPAAWLSAMATLVSKESGGNPAAINPAVAGASGEHAEGIAQTIPSTFAAYALPGHPNIFSAVDDLIASVRYIMAAYGSPDRIPGLVSGGTYVGYAGGGWINEPVLGIGAISRQLYTFGEAGREYVTPEAALAAGAGRAAAPLIGSYHTNYYGTGDAAAAMRELAFTLRRAKQGAFYQPGS